MLLLIVFFIETFQHSWKKLYICNAAFVQSNLPFRSQKDIVFSTILEEPIMIHSDDVFSWLKLSRYLWFISTVSKVTTNKFVLFWLCLSHEYQSLPYLRSRSNPNEDSIFFLNGKRSKGWKIIGRLMITPIFIIDIHAFEDKKFLKMPANVALTDQKRLICFEMSVNLEFFWWLNFLPDWIV